MKICVDSQMEYECSVISFIYIMRMLKLYRGSFSLTEETYKGVVLAAMVLANKIWDDFAMKNSEYCSIFYGLTLQRVNDLELAMFLALRNKLFVNRSEYAAAHFSIQELITKEEIERVRNLPSNQRVPVLTTKTILSREKSRSVLSEASSAISSHSVRSLNTADMMCSSGDELFEDAAIFYADGMMSPRSDSGEDKTDLRFKQPSPRPAPCRSRRSSSVSGRSSSDRGQTFHVPFPSTPPTLTASTLGDNFDILGPAVGPAATPVTRIAPGVIRSASSASTSADPGSSSSKSQEEALDSEGRSWCCGIWPFRSWCNDSAVRDVASGNGCHAYNATAQSQLELDDDEDIPPPETLASISLSNVGII
jgi:hypothetical protein